MINYQGPTTNWLFHTQTGRYFVTIERSVAQQLTPYRQSDWTLAEFCEAIQTHCPVANFDVLYVGDDEQWDEADDRQLEELLRGTP